MKQSVDSKPRVNGSLFWPAQWRVFGPLTGEEPLLTSGQLAGLPDILEVAGQRYQPLVVNAADNRLDFAALYGGVELHRTAYVFVPLTSEKDELVTLGMGADWWMQAWLDGAIILETTDTGNGVGGAQVAITNFLVNVRMTRGPHVLVVRFISGSAGALLALGGPHEIRAQFRLHKDSPLPVTWRRPVNLASVIVKNARPVGRVERTLYIPSPMPGAAACLSASYLGGGLRREEINRISRTSDWADESFRRLSEDNGRTWSPWQPVHAAWPSQNNITKEESPVAVHYDPVSGRTVQAVFQRLLIGEPNAALDAAWKGEIKYFDHGFWRHSADDGRTWSEQRLLRYEPGPEFDPADWSKPNFFKANQMYGGYIIAQRYSGELVYPVCVSVEHRNEDGSVEKVCGVRCFIGRWNQSSGNYEWKLSKPVSVSHRVSGRGLLEPNVAVLQDGRILLEMRGSNIGVASDPWRGTIQKESHRWIAVSSDGGLTWGPVSDMRYDDGEKFYSPSAMSRLIRSRKTGKLYWAGNICAEPPDGNMPRYPLYIAEVDEEHPALKRRILTLIDTRDPQTESASLQLSNFALFENRETLELELYLTRLGEQLQSMGANQALYTAHAYKYTLTL